MTHLVVITPVDRYLGFSAPLSPVDQFKEVGEQYGGRLKLSFLDPQRAQVTIDGARLALLDGDGQVVDGDVFFAFGHEQLDRTMTKYIVRMLELAGKTVINGYNALTLLDDKALMALEFSKASIPLARSAIVSARSSADSAIGFLDTKQIISKMSGFSAGGVGIVPAPPDVNHVAPLQWAARMDNKPRVLQNDLYETTDAVDPRSVVRAYVVGGKIVGCYTTNGYGIVNSAGLARESQAERYHPSPSQSKILIQATKVVEGTGFCRIDAVGDEDKFAIIEVNPLARIDADHFGFSVTRALIEYAIELDTGVPV